MSSELEQSTAPVESPVTEPVVDTPATTVDSDVETEENGKESVETKPEVVVPPPSINDENAFPALGGSSQASTGSPISWGPSMKSAPAAATSKKTATKSTFRPSTIQESFHIDAEISLNVSKVEFGKIVNELKKKYSTSIESTLSAITKSRSFVISGKPNDVANVKKELIRRLTKPLKISFNIPARTRSAVIGASGKNLRPILEATAAKIDIEKNSTPGPQSNDSDEEEEIKVTIDGDVDGVHEAKRRILAIVNEETKNLTTRISVPEEISAFVQSFNIDEENLKVSGPNKNGIITIQGARDDVLVKKTEINSQLETLKVKVKTDDKTIPKKFHQFIKPTDILKQFKVVVKVPASDSDDEKVSFIGLQSDINSAIQYARTQTSQIIVDTLDISRAHGANVKHARSVAAYFTYSGLVSQIAQETNTVIALPPYGKLASDELKNVNVDISAPKDAAQSIKEARQKIISAVNDLDPARVRYVTDIVAFLANKAVSATESVCKENNAAVVPLSELSQHKTNEIILFLLKIDGEDFGVSPERVESVFAKLDHALDDLRKAQADLKSVTLDVASDKQQFIEGPNGTTLKALLHSFGASSIIIKLHSNGSSDAADKVFIQGAKTDVAKAEKEIASLLKDAEDVKDIYSYEKEILVPTNVLSRLIGKNGANLKVLRDEYDVSIDVEKNPAGEKATLTITGYKYNVGEAETNILASSKKWADETTKTLHIPQKYHGSLIGASGQYVKRLQDKYSVRITFTQGSDDVVIRGPSRGAVKAEEEVKGLLDYLIENGYTKELEVPTSALSRVIGKGGETIRGIAAEAGIEIDVQNHEEGAKNSKILLTGTRKGLKEAENSILAIVKEFEDTITVELEVEPKYYKDILGPKGSVKNTIIAKAGGSEDQQRRLLQIPDQGSEDKKITSTGPKKVVESIIEQVKQIVQDKENAVTEVLQVAKDKHRVIIGQGGSVRRSIETDFNVNVNIPNSQSDSSDVTIIGLPENVEKAKAKIIELTADDWKTSVDVPAYLHAAVSERGAFTRKVRIENNVEIEHGNLSSRAFKLSSQFPTPPKSAFGSEEETIKFTVDETSEDKKDDTVIPWRLKGSDEDVKKVEAQIKSRLEKFAKDDTSGFLWVKNPSVFGKVVGPQGSRLNNIRNKSGSQIYVPRNSDKVNDVIFLRGTKDSLEKAQKLLSAEIQKK